MRHLTFVLLAAVATSLFAAETPPPAYTADMVAGAGHKIRTHIWSDGKIVKSQSADGTSDAMSITTKSCPGSTVPASRAFRFRRNRRDTP
jgi:hypothetical protein